MSLIVGMLVVMGLVVAAVIYARSTPDKRSASASHAQMARVLDRVLNDDMVRPLLDDATADHMAQLVADYYDDEPRRLS